VEAFSFDTMTGLINTGSIYAITHGATASGLWDYSSINAPITNSGIIAAQSDGQVHGIVRFNGGREIHDYALPDDVENLALMVSAFGRGNSGDTAVADYNGDGHADIRWRNTVTGTMSDWLGFSNGGFQDNAANAYTKVPTTWHVQPHSDLI
jgi:hypothetical protein